MLRANPPVDPFPPIVEPADPGVLSGLSRHLSGGDKPPAGADLDVVRQAMPDVADADQPVQAGGQAVDLAGVGARSGLRG